MVKPHVKIPDMRSIFEKDDKQIYTKKALLYQDILQYPLKTGNDKFKLWAIGSWLLEKNKNSPDFYGEKHFVKHTSLKNRFASVRDRIEAHVQDLVYLHLLNVTKTKAEKSGGPTNLYTHSGDGYFITWLSNRRNSREHNKANEILFELIQSTLFKYDSRFFIFLSKLYDRYKEMGILNQVFDLIEAIIREQENINSVFEVVELVPNIPTIDPSIHKKFHDITLEILNSVDEEIRVSQLFYIKSHLENRILEQYPPKEWEDYRRKYLNDYSTTILYGKCHKCQWEDFVDADTNQFVNVHIDNSVHADCPVCNSKNSLHVSTKLPDRPILIVRGLTIR